MNKKMSDQEFKSILSEILLDDPASETPQIEHLKKGLTKKKLQERLDDLIEEFETLELQINIEDYYEASSRLKQIKDGIEYQTLMADILAMYEQESLEVAENINPEKPNFVPINQTVIPKDFEQERTQTPKNKKNIFDSIKAKLFN